MPQTIQCITAIATYAVGVSLVSLIPVLPSLLVVVIIGMMVLAWTAYILFRSLWSWLPLSSFLIGVVIGLGYGHWFQAHQLPAEFERQTHVVVGHIASLPVYTEKSARFIFVTAIGESKNLHIKVRLNWYSAPELRLQQRWRLKVKLRRPHGFASPGAMDFEGWAAREGVQATGHVLSGELLSQPTSFSIRQHLYTWLVDSASSVNLGVLKALLLGDKSGISTEQWQLLNGTGTTHLVVISGLHIGLMAWLGYWISLLLARFGLLPLQVMPLPRIAAIFSLLLAGGYAFMAGVSVPVQRALIMTTVAMAGPLLGLRPAPSTLLIIAFALVVTIDPLAVTSIGFWYSFIAVGGLIYGLSGRYGSIGSLAKWLRPQWLIFCIMTPLLLSNGQPVSLLSPLINLLAIPFIGLLVVPLLLLSSLLSFVASPISLSLLNSVEHLLNGFWWGLTCCIDRLTALTLMSIPQWPVMLAATAGGILLISPLPVLLRLLAPALLFPWVFPVVNKLDKGQAKITVLDVGQGLSVLIHTKNHTLVYDTGDAFTDRFNAADCVIVPYLRRAGIQSIDRIIISHGDKDHVGGLKPLLKHYDCGDILSGTTIPYYDKNILFCQAGNQWNWDGVQFNVLASGGQWKKANDRSCVLKVTAGNESVLLTGDISYRIEEHLLHLTKALESTVLLAPHHGSRFSSSLAFLSAVNPRYVLFSAGYKNRFSHPAKATLQRVVYQGADYWNTAWHGTLTFELGNGNCEINGYRCTHRRYWWHESEDASLAKMKKGGTVNKY
ncbi:MAG: DNA internalization-related competence protein ComEC/Rec2 [Endozoicomonas sp. (ex Botrylloides leachii)]|nr:DNA internalization-related competence protein ComEC/Rec2 [Endozoicomonas sp. (ex Botrylloides leachii)]